jgi:zinc D-Ala-D-Ala carboxypeptidase
MKLSKNFTLEELFHSDTALAQGIDNVSNDKVILLNLMALVCNVLQPVRTLMNQSFKIRSGYRSPELNKLIGSSSNSQHTKGQAVDIQCADIDRLFDELKNYDVDQCIKEDKRGNRWVHVSYSIESNRNQYMLAVYENGKMNYSNI